MRRSGSMSRPDVGADGPGSACPVPPSYLGSLILKWLSLCCHFQKLEETQLCLLRSPDSCEPLVALLQYINKITSRWPEAHSPQLKTTGRESACVPGALMPLSVWKGSSQNCDQMRRAWEPSGTSSGHQAPHLAKDLFIWTALLSLLNNNFC